jgi:hypothetical protein
LSADRLVQLAMTIELNEWDFDIEKWHASLREQRLSDLESRALRSYVIFVIFMIIVRCSD